MDRVNVSAILQSVALAVPEIIAIAVLGSGGSRKKILGGGLAPHHLGGNHG